MVQQYVAHDIRLLRESSVSGAQPIDASVLNSPDNERPATTEFVDEEDAGQLANNSNDAVVGLELECCRSVESDCEQETELAAL